MWQWKTSFLHKPEKNIDDDFYCNSNEFPNHLFINYGIIVFINYYYSYHRLLIYLPNGKENIYRMESLQFKD